MGYAADTGEARWEFLVSELSKKLKENRTKHIKEYKEALEGYKTKVEKKLEKMLSDHRKGKDVDLYIKLEKPRSYEKDYDRIIEVLEWTTAETVKLTLSEFDKYVRDNWSWTESFKLSNSNYL